MKNLKDKIEENISSVSLEESLRIGLNDKPEEGPEEVLQYLRDLENSIDYYTCRNPRNDIFDYVPCVKQNELWEVDKAFLNRDLVYYAEVHKKNKNIQEIYNKIKSILNEIPESSENCIFRLEDARIRTGKWEHTLYMLNNGEGAVYIYMVDHYDKDKHWIAFTFA